MTVVAILLGILTVLCGCGVVFAARPLHSALFLVATLFLVAVHFALLGADFVAAIQVLVYAGAIMVLVIFVIMLLGPDADTGTEGQSSFLGNAIAACSCGVFVAILVIAIVGGGAFPALEPAADEFRGTTALIGVSLFRTYLYPFELISLLVLVGIIGSVVLGFEPKRPLAKGRGLRAKQVGGGEEA